MMADWQPIETAPKDDAVILAFWPSPLPAYRYDFITFDGATWVTADEGETVTSPTHWKPLPEPPGAT